MGVHALLLSLGCCSRCCLLLLKSFWRGLECLIVDELGVVGMVLEHVSDFHHKHTGGLDVEVLPIWQDVFAQADVHPYSLQLFWILDVAVGLLCSILSHSECGYLLAQVMPVGCDETPETFWRT